MNLIPNFLNNTNKLLIFVALLGLFSLLSSFVMLTPTDAATGIYGAVNFQGKIVNKTDGTNLLAGSPSCVVNGASNDTCDFRLQVYDGPDPGTATLLWQKSYPNYEIGANDGVFDFQVGVCSGSTVDWTGCESGSGVNFDTDALYVVLRFDDDGDADYAEDYFVKRMTSVPYALNAGSWDGVDLDATDPEIKARNTDDDLKLSANGTGRLILNSSATGDIQFFSAANYITSAGTLVLAGSATLGDANTDTTTIRGLVTLTDSASSYPLRFGADVNLYRGTSNRLDLATGDSFNIVSGQYTQASSSTTGSSATITSNSLTSGTGLAISSTATGFTSGKLLTLTKTGASGSAAFTGDIANIAYSHTFNGGVNITHTGNVLDISRNITLNAAQTHNITGALMTLSDSATQSLGTLNHSAPVLDLTQNYTASTGTALYVKNYGSGNSFQVDDESTDTTPFVIDNSGKVGIGDTTPDHLLDVAGNIGLDASSYINFGDTDGTSGYGFFDNGGTLQYKNSGGSWTNFGAASSLKWNNLLDPDGDLALSTGSWTSTFTAGAATSTNNLFNFTDTASNTGTGYLVNITTASGSTLKPFHISAAGTEAITVLANGNVGVGDTNPGDKLDVTGIIDTSEYYQLDDITVLNLVNTGTLLLGNEAGASIAAGSDYNIYAGYRSGYASGGASDYNVALGYEAGYYNNSGYNNIFIGQAAGKGTTTYNTSLENVAVGMNALQSINGGDGNVAIGKGAGSSNTSAIYNTYVGYNAGLYNVDASNNVFIGTTAGQGAANYTGSQYNTGIGAGALSGISSSSTDNTAIGRAAGSNITTGDYNIIIGSGISAPSATGNYQLNIGNTLYGDLSTVKIGIGDSSPDHKLDVAGNIGLDAGGYINYGDTDGTSGYGFFDNAGTLQAKNSGGSWYNIATSNDLHSAVTLAGSYDYLTLSGQQITLNQIDLTTDVTGILPVGNGGTGTSTAFTAGSIVFAGASGVYSQDNANFFWDNSNDFLGLGTNTPAYTLDVLDTQNDYLASIYNTNTGTSAGGLFIRSDGTGNLLNLNYAGSDIFSVSSAQASFNVPTSFNSAGDASFAYDIILTNQTSSNIQSYGPLTIDIGESFESNNLTLQTYNNGSVLIENATTGNIATFLGTGNVGIGTASPDDVLDVAGNLDITGYYKIGGTQFVRSANGSSILVGPNAGSGIVAGAYDNIFIGYEAGFTSNGSGVDYNIGIGSSSLHALTSGNQNVAVGLEAMNAMTSGYRNVGIGSYALGYDTDSWENVAIGYGSMSNNNIGYSNTAVGYYTGQNSTGDQNTFLGAYAGEGNTGSNNVLIGFDVGSNAASFSNQLYIDNSNTSSPLIWGDFSSNYVNINGSLGIGDASPDHKLDVAGNIGLDAGGYINFGDTDGTSGYGFFDNGGTLQYKNSGGSWTNIGAATSLKWSDLLNPTANLSLSTASYTSTFTAGNATSTNNLFNFTDTASNTGTGYLVNITTASGSSLKPFHISAAGTEAITVLANGNVGVGDTNPGDKLDVVGNIDTTSYYKLGGTTILNRVNTESLLLGTNAGANLPAGANYNTYLGYYAGGTGAGDADWNVAIGYYAGAAATGDNNVFLGNESGVGTTSGSQNVGIGNQAGYYNQTGTYNFFAGYQAGRGLANYTGADDNIAIGTTSLLKLASNGDGNIALGKEAGYGNTSGGYNTYIGLQAGYNNSTGLYNFFAGLDAGYGTGGTYAGSDSNIVIGYEALYAITGNNDYNVVLGYQAGRSTTSGGNNIFQGYQAGYYNQTGTSNVFLGNSSGKGTANYTGSSFNTSIGAYALSSIGSNALNNIALGYLAGDNITTGDSNIIIGYNIDGPSATGNNQLSIGNLIYGTSVDGTGTSYSTGSIGIGDNSPDHKLDVAGNIGLNAGGYINFGDTDGTSGYGFFDNAGTLQAKNSGGSWYNIATSNDLHSAVTLAGSYDYITLSGQQITRNQIDLTTDVTGILPVGNGGTGTSTAFTAGSIVFAGASGVYSQDNANFFWDNSNDFLGLGTNTPAYTLDVLDTQNDYLASIYNTNTGTSAGGLFIRSDGTGNLLNLNYAGSDIFTVSSTLATFNTPAAFNAAGDVSIAYDLNFQNQTSSYIKTLAPLYIETGENFESNDLTLRTFNSGGLVFDAPGGVVLSQAQSWNIADGSTTSLNIESGLLNLDTSNSRVGIGTTSPNQALEVNGRIRMGTWTADGNTAVYYNSSTGDIGIQSSDRRLKKNITPISDALNIINNISGYTFNWKTEADNSPKTVGVIAQELYDVMPELTYSFVGEDGQVYFGVHYDKIAPVLVQGIKEQGTIINTNKADSDLKYTDLNTKYDQLATQTANSGSSALGGVQLDFVDLKNNLTLDATTSINLDANAVDLSIDGGTLFVSHNNFVGINTQTPTRRLDIADNTNPQLRLTQTNNINFAEFKVDGSGNLTINTTGTQIYFGNKNLKTDGNIIAGGSLQILSGKILNKNGQTILSFTEDGKIDQFADFTGAARRPRTLNYNPEYQNAVKTSFYGAGTDTDVTGTMTSDIEGTTGGFRTYYNWQTNELDKNYQTIALRVELPSEFDAWNDNKDEEKYAISIDYKTSSDDINNNGIDIFVFNPEESSDTDVFIQNDIVSENISQNPLITETEWSTFNIKASDLIKTDTDTSPKWDKPNQTGIIYIRLGSNSEGKVQIGEIKLNYLSKW